MIMKVKLIINKLNFKTMKKMKQIKSFIGLLIVVSIFASCSTSDKVVTGNFIQKRKYNNGFYVSIKGKVNKAEVIDNSELAINNSTVSESVIDKTKTQFSYQTTDNENTETIDNSLIASSDDNFIPLLNNSVSTVDLSSFNSNTRNKTIANPKVEKLENKIQKKLERKLEKLEKKDNTATSAQSSGGESQLVALLLCIFVGGLGIHRFYLGYIGIGIIQLLTLGGCGIWSLIDLIRIITGDLGPKNGSYSKTL